MDGSFLSQDVNQDCSFADLLVRLPQVSDSSVQVVEKSRPKTVSKSWTVEESRYLEELSFEGTNLSTIAQKLDRTFPSVENQIRKLNLKRFKELSRKDTEYLKQNYWILDVETLAKKLGRQPASIRYFANKLGLKRAKLDSAEPPIPRRLMPYDMVKRLSVLERNSPDSKSRVDDSVVIFYDKKGPSTPMMAMHLDDLCLALDKHFNRRDGVTAAALTHGYKAV
ncbi:gcrA cell cycle regulator family protein [Vibrio splendidus]